MLLSAARMSHLQIMPFILHGAGYTFPYLFDESQQVAKAYKAACTPEFYIFDSQQQLQYHGQFDSSRPRNNVPVTGTCYISGFDLCTILIPCLPAAWSLKHVACTPRRRGHPGCAG